MQGSEFNEKYPNTLFAVFSNSADLNMTSNDHSFLRINIDSIKINDYIYLVNVPDDCEIAETGTYTYGFYVELAEYTSTKLIMNYPLHRDYFEIIGDNYALDCVKFEGHLLKYVKYKTPEICLSAFQKNGCALEFVEEQTPELCLAAVQKDGWALRYVKEQTPELCLAAVQNYPGAICHVDAKFKHLFQ